ncbi:MAG: protein SCO1/2 [Salibacteraceae bacterium]
MSRVLFLAIFIFVGIGFTYYFVSLDANKEDPLPIINPVDIEEEMVDPELIRVGRGHKVGDFSFLNQEGKTITSDEVKGKIHVAEYFFTTCKSICPIMTEQMQRIHNEFKQNDELKLLSFTVDPEADTVAQMKWYADIHDADAKQWHFLTGDKEELYQLARRSYFVLKPAEAQNLGDAGSDFIHTNNFVLVDIQSRIRGYYDGTSELEVSQLIHDIYLLMKEQE